MNLNWILSRLFIIGLIHFLEGTDMKKTHTNENLRNLTSITWAHAVNNQKDLNVTLKSNVNMIEADIVLGTLNSKPKSGELIPIMAHPPSTTSDISLDKFLTDITESSKNQTNIKGVKLDFKSIAVFKKSIDILKTHLPKMNNSIWLNADIIKGPVNSTTTPVDSQQFLNGCKIKEFENVTLSLGWTTMWGKNYTEGSYNKTEIDNMIAAIKGNNILHNITFAVRAGIAAQSLKQFDELIKDIGHINNVTFTIWSHNDDNVNITNLKNLILHFGVNKVYLDLPEDVSNKLRLDKPKTNSAVSSTFINFTIITFCILIASLTLQRKSI